MRRPDDRRLELAVPLSADLVLARVGSLPSSDSDIGALLRGESRPAIFGWVRGERFCLMTSKVLPRFHDVRAYGTVRAVDPLRSVVTVELRRSTQSKWTMRLMWAMYLLLVGSALLSATQDAVFIVFAAFVAVVGGIVIWGNRERSEDRDRLRAFVLGAFPESIGARFEL